VNLFKPAKMQVSNALGLSLKQLYFKNKFMKKALFFMAVLALALYACQEKKLAEIRFCSDIRANDPCIGEDSVFLRGTNVWAQLWFASGFSDTVVTASLFGYQDGQRILIESMVYEINEGQQVLMESLFFDSSGHFEVEFRGSGGNLLDQKGFEIW
jgi:hypothetical protein